MAKPSQRKSQANIVRFLSQVEINCERNQAALIDLAMRSQAYGEVPWERPSWNVTEAMQHRKRGHRSSRKREWLHFTQHRPVNQGAGVGPAFTGRFADIAKALTRLRYEKGSQCVSSQMVFIRAWRYIYDALALKHHDITFLTQQELNVAAQAAFDREDEAAAYKVIGHMEEIADLLDRNRLTQVRLEWRSTAKKRPKDVDLEVEEPQSDRLPREEVIIAIGQLYMRIPAYPAEHPESGDRLLILIVALLVLTGFRIGEALSLMAIAVHTARDGSKYLEYYPQKWVDGVWVVEKKEKPLMTETAELVELVINELIHLTAEQRKVAQYIFDRDELPVALPAKNELSKGEVIAALGLPKTNYAQWLNKRGILFRTECVSLGGYRKGTRTITYIQRQDLIDSLRKDHYSLPILQASNGIRIELHEALCVCFHNQMRETAATLKHAVVPINEQHVRDFLVGRVSEKIYVRVDGTVSEFTSEIKTVFDKYGFMDENGSPYTLRSHGPRHYLNNLLDEGGAPDLVQAEWFGRKREMDNKVYQHKTPIQRARDVRRDLLANPDSFGGALVRQIKIVPVDHRDAYMQARVTAIHDVGAGMCVHIFTQSPCPNDGQCSADCDDYLWVKEDEGRANELKRMTVSTWITLREARKATAEDTWGADLWVVHNQVKFDRQMGQLRSMGIQDFDPEKHLQELESDGKKANQAQP